MSKVSTSTRTYTKTEGSGANKVTTTVVEETITYSDGRKEVNKTETRSTGESAGDSQRLQNNNPSSSKGGNDKPQSLKDFRSEALKAHNAYRNKHKAAPLKAAKDLDDYAQKWAEHLADSGSFKHSDCTAKDGTRLGENIASKWSSSGATYTGQEVVDYWYSEVSKHDYGSQHPMGSGHFSQVVWKGSKEVGMGQAKGKDGKAICVGSYRPAGNMAGKYLENIGRP